MPKPCTVCNHPNRTEIEAALAAGGGVAALARQHGLSESALRRHRAHTPAQTQPVNPPGLALDAMPFDGLPEKQARAVLALLAEPGPEAAARAAGVSHSTLWRWLNYDSAFRAAYLAARRHVYSLATARLAALCSAGAEVLGAIARDPTAPPAARVSAVRTIFERAAEAVLGDDVDARLRAIEERLAGKEATA